jgi:hypothetical protein
MPTSPVQTSSDIHTWGEAGQSGKPNDQPAGDPGAGPQDDELGEEAVTAAHEDRGHVLSVAALGGHAIMAPGPDLAGWLACGKATERDDAALVTSITAWRKVTSWAQAQELAAVAELARRRVTGAVDVGGQDCDRAADAGDRDPVADTGRVITTWPDVLCSVCRGGLWPDGAASQRVAQ